ncbi:hypothetical protein ACFVYG_22340 [Streptomyces sp. NPDC058256]|uniref:hypothetical protein n=1 Tax=Streptomyces sp. NPDC058256 TaxID=3346408 RepID=UPI0036E90CD2
MSLTGILLTLFTLLQVASALVALFLTYKPSFSGRARQRAFYVLAATTLLSGVAHLVTGDTFDGTVITAVAVLFLIPPRLMKRLVRRTRGRTGGKSKK